MARRVIGQRLLRWFEALIQRIPLASIVYSSARQLLDILQTKPMARSAWCWWISRTRK